MLLVSVDSIILIICLFEVWLKRNRTIEVKSLFRCISNNFHTVKHIQVLSHLYLSPSKYFRLALMHFEALQKFFFSDSFEVSRHTGLDILNSLEACPLENPCQLWKKKEIARSSVRRIRWMMQQGDFF